MRFKNPLDRVLEAGEAEISYWINSVTGRIRYCSRKKNLGEEKVQLNLSQDLEKL